MTFVSIYLIVTFLSFNSIYTVGGYVDYIIRKINNISNTKMYQLFYDEGTCNIQQRLMPIFIIAVIPLINISLLLSIFLTALFLTVKLLLLKIKNFFKSLTILNNNGEKIKFNVKINKIIKYITFNKDI